MKEIKSAGLRLPINNVVVLNLYSFMTAQIVLPVTGRRCGSNFIQFCHILIILTTIHYSSLQYIHPFAKPMHIPSFHTSLNPLFYCYQKLAASLKLFVRIYQIFHRVIRHVSCTCHYLFLPFLVRNIVAMTFMTMCIIALASNISNTAISSSTLLAALKQF